MRAMVKIARGLIALAAAAVGTAAPAAADGTEGIPEGIYTYIQDGVPSGTWKITPLCVPTVGAAREPLEDPVACKLQVEGKGAQSGAYRLTGGQWTYSTSLLSGMTCPDGHSAATTETYSFDGSLNGTYSQSHNRVCGQPPGIDKHPFTLAFVEPLPVPVNRYPLNCQDNPQHLCS